MKVGSLFTGVGGLDLGFLRAGYQVDWMSEVGAYQRKVLALRFPDTPIYGDIQQLFDLPRVDVLIGGFPCTDISKAGDRKGIDDGSRSGLWREFIRLIRLLRPSYIVVENVSALLSPHRRERRPAPISRVLGDLSESGYDAEWAVVPAAAVGAPHLRERVFMVSYPRRDGVERVFTQPIPRFPAFSWVQDIRGVEDLRGRSEYPQPLIRGASDGVPYWMDRLECIGNAVVPQVAEYVALSVLNHYERSAA